MHGQGEQRWRSVTLCSDEYCLRVARYRKADRSKTSLPLYLCEKCYEALSAEKKSVYKERVMPVLINNRRATG